MSVVDGQSVNAAVTNAAFVSRLVDTSTVGVLALSNVTDVNSGASVPNSQQRMNELSTQVGHVDGDANNLVYSSNNVVVDSENLKQSIERVDVKFANINLGELVNVDLTGETDGHVLTRAGGVWVSAAGGGGGATALNDLTDVTITAVAANEKLKRNAGNTLWENVSDNLENITDVTGTGTALQLMLRNAGNTAYEFVTDLSDRILGGGTATATNKIKLTNETNANLLALARDEGAIYYDDTNSTVVVDDGTTLINLAAGGGASVLNDLTDVSAAAPAANQLMQRNAGNTQYELVSQLFNLLIGGGTASATNGVILSSDTEANINLLSGTNPGALYRTTDTNKVLFDTGAGLTDLTLTGGGGGSTLANTINQDLSGGSYTVPASTLFDGSLIIGGVSASTGSPELGYMASIDGSAGAGVSVKEENVSGWVDGVTMGTAGEYTIDITSLGLTVEPNIHVTVNDESSDNNTKTAYVTAASATSIEVKTGDIDGDIAYDFKIQVIPMGADATTQSPGPIMYSYFIDGTSAGSAAEQRKNGSLTSLTSVSLAATGRFVIDYTSLGLVNEPAIFCTVKTAGAPAQDVSCHFFNFTNTSAQVTLSQFGSEANLDFYFTVVPVGGDAVAPTANSLYASPIDFGGGTTYTVKNSNATWIDSVTSGTAGVVTIDYTSLGLTVIPAAQLVVKDATANVAPGRANFIQSISTTSMTIRQGEGSAAVLFPQDFDVMLMPMGADFSLTTAGGAADGEVIPLKAGSGAVIQLTGSQVEVDGDNVRAIAAGETVRLTGGEFT